MRGKVLVAVKFDFLVGITPAYAGKRNINFNNVEVDGDHPRLCGEKGNFLRLRQHLSGSPPPMRGKARK